MRMNDGITRLLTLLAGIASAGAYYMYARLSTDRDIHIAVSGLLILLPLPFYQSIQKLSPFYHTTMSDDPGAAHQIRAAPAEMHLHLNGYCVTCDEVGARIHHGISGLHICTDMRSSSHT